MLYLILYTELNVFGSSCHNLAIFLLQLDKQFLGHYYLFGFKGLTSLGNVIYPYNFVVTSKEMSLI